MLPVKGSSELTLMISKYLLNTNNYFSLLQQGVQRTEPLFPCVSGNQLAIDSNDSSSQNQPSCSTVKSEFESPTNQPQQESAKEILSKSTELPLSSEDSLTSSQDSLSNSQIPSTSTQDNKELSSEPQESDRTKSNSADESSSSKL